MSGSTFGKLSASLGGNEKAPPVDANRGGEANQQRGWTVVDSTGNGRPAQGAEAIDVYTRDAWAARRLLCNLNEPSDLEACSPAFRPVADRAAKEPAEGKAREAIITEWLEAQGDDFADGFEAAMDRAAPEGPPPADEPLATGDEWPPLRLKEAPPAEPFPLDVFPPMLARFCQEVATSTRTAIDIPALAIVAVAAAAIGQSVRLRIKRTWHEYSLLYMIVVASAGKSKTPALSIVLSPLRTIDERLREESEAAHEAWKEDKEAYERAKRSKAKDAPEIPPPGPEPPQLRAIVNDHTRESLVILLQDNPRGLLCFMDEALAWVGSWNQYKAKGTDEQFWLSNYNCVPYGVDRKGGRESTYARYPGCSFLGGIQPRLVHRLQGESGTDNGFHHRIAFAYPDAFPKREWTEAEVTEEAERDWAEAIERLHAVKMRETNGHLEPWKATLRPEAKARFTEWYNVNGSAMDQADDEDHEGRLAKGEGRLARLALILSRVRLAYDKARPLVDSNGVPAVELEDVEGAIRATAWLASHAERVAVALTGGAGSADALALLRWIKRNRKGEFREADVRDHLRSFQGNSAALTAALQSLERDGAIRRKSEHAIKGKRGRKPSPLYEVRPELL